MFNRILNLLVDASTARKMKKYITYPATKTAIVFVNVQQGLMMNPNALTTNLEQLQTLARDKGFRIVHAPYGSVAGKSYPSPAQTLLTQLLDTAPEGRNIPATFTPQAGDIVLSERMALSAFFESDLDRELKEANIEHLIIAGPYANLALDSTIRDGVQLGYHVTFLKDCSSTMSDEANLAVETTIPRYAQTVLNLETFKLKCQ